MELVGLITTMGSQSCVPAMFLISTGFPRDSVVKNPPAMQETWFDPWIRKIRWRRAWQHDMTEATEHAHKITKNLKQGT